MKIFKTIPSLFAAFIAVSSAFAEIWTPSVFSDNMMLQRDAFVRVWGTSAPNAKVEVEFGGKRKSAKADADGKWSLKLDKMPADKNPREMTIYENGKVGKKIGNILVGEVWILGGQSNMQWSAYNTTDFEKLSARANYPNLRYFNQQTKHLSRTPAKDSLQGKWFAVTSRKLAASCSATGIYFGEQLMKDLDVPVGLVFAALGASKMVAWIPEDKISQQKYLESEWSKFNREMKAYDYKKIHEKWRKDAAAWDIEAKKAKAEKRKPVPERRPQEPVELSSRMPAQTPVYLYNAVISPIEGFTARGAIWYQGESDSFGETLDNFQLQFDFLVNTWREKFGNKNMPFIWAQLTSIGKGSGWPMTRWKQFLSSKSLKNGAVVNLIDLGERDDVHPRDKTSVGLRFEKLALNKVYGMKNVHASAPEMSKVAYSGDSARILFETFGRKLAGKGEPRGFEVLVDGKWVEAAPVLDGKTVVLKSPDGGAVRGVRYLWTAWAQPNVWLFNQDGLPAFSFIDEKK